MGKFVHTVAYASRSLHKHELNYPITEFQILGFVCAAKYFCAYLLTLLPVCASEQGM